jgi:hypothetical protein
MPTAYREGLAKFMKRVCADAGIQYGSSYDRDERGRRLEPTLGPEYEEGSSPEPAPAPASGIPQLEFIL